MNADPDADMAALASYVEQSDALLGVLTVQETITFAARLRSVSRIRAAACIPLTFEPPRRPASTLQRRPQPSTPGLQLSSRSSDSPMLSTIALEMLSSVAYPGDRRDVSPLAPRWSRCPAYCFWTNLRAASTVGRVEKSCQRVSSPVSEF